MIVKLHFVKAFSKRSAYFGVHMSLNEKECVLILCQTSVTTFNITLNSNIKIYLSIRFR